MRSLDGKAAEAYVSWLEDSATPPPPYVIRQTFGGWFWGIEVPGSSPLCRVRYESESQEVLPTRELAVASAWRHFEESNQ